MKLRIGRLSSAAALCLVCACTVGAGLAWACVPRDWGWSPPAAPEATPTAGATDGAGGGAGASAPSGASVTSGNLAPAQATPSQPAPSRSRQQARGNAKSPARTPAQQPVRSPAGTQTGTFTPRSAPTQTQGGAHSTGVVTATPRSARPAVTAHARHAGTKKAGKTTAASTRPVRFLTDGDAWSGAGNSSASLVPNADGSAAPTSGAGTRFGLGAGLLGLGLVGLLAAVAVAGERRRRAPARG